MTTEQTYRIEIRITQEHGKFGCEIATPNGVVLCDVTCEYAHPNDAIYHALHGLALENNFSGCLKNNR
nr:MAG TPA: hypothetical protein [Caudoviricetes sp.]